MRRAFPVFTELCDDSDRCNGRSSPCRAGALLQESASSLNAYGASPLQTAAAQKLRKIA
jgi:hypothetical protein